MLNLNPPVFKPRPRRRRLIQTRNGRIASQTKRKSSTSQQDENPLDSQINGYSGPNLPEDIWCYIHSLMPMRDAAKVACVSRAFVRSWRCHPDLHFSKETLGLDENVCQKDGITDFNSRVDSILKKHSGIGLKAFRLDVYSVYDKDPCHLDRLDSLLQVVVKPGIEQLDFIFTMYGNYNFPCSLLSDGTRGTLRYLSLASCRFHPMVGLGCLTSLTTLNLTFVHIKGDELWCLLSSSPSLERFELRHCDSIVCLKIPCLQQLNYLEVVCSSNCLRAIESKAPNLSSVKFVGDLRIPLSLENTKHIKILDTHYYCSLAFYARADLPSVMPNLEALTIRSDGEVDTVPMVPSKFLHLKYLSLAIGGLTFDYLSLVSFLDAAPSLETFILEVIREFTKERVTVFNNPSDLRMIPGHHHSRLKHVKIIKFVAAKTVVELTCQILQSAASLECLTLDTTNGHPGCSVSKTGKCVMMSKDTLVRLSPTETRHPSRISAIYSIKITHPNSSFSNRSPKSRNHRSTTTLAARRYSIAPRSTTTPTASAAGAAAVSSGTAWSGCFARARCSAPSATPPPFLCLLVAKLLFRFLRVLHQESKEDSDDKDEDEAPATFSSKPLKSPRMTMAKRGQVHPAAGGSKRHHLSPSSRRLPAPRLRLPTSVPVPAAPNPGAYLPPRGGRVLPRDLNGIVVVVRGSAVPRRAGCAPPRRSSRGPSPAAGAGCMPRRWAWPASSPPPSGVRSIPTPLMGPPLWSPEVCIEEREKRQIRSSFASHANWLLCLPLLLEAVFPPMYDLFQVCLSFCMLCWRQP